MSNKIHSVYFKFLLISTITIILSSVLSGTIMYKLVDSYMLSGKINDLKGTADTVSDLVIQYLSSGKDFKDFISEEHDKNEYFYNIYSIMKISNQTQGTNIFITDTDGYIRFSYPLLPNLAEDRLEHGSAFMPNSLVANLNYDSDSYRFSNKKQYSNILQEEGYSIDKGDFYGLFKEEKTPYLTISKRLAYIEPEQRETKIFGTVTVSVSTPEILQVQGRVILYFVLSTLVAVLIEVLVLSYATKKMTYPIRELQEAASALAAGNYDRSIERTTKDEIGDLVDSFNSMTLALENLDNMRNDFIANVSHELRTPMTSIGGFIDGILDGVIPEEKHDYYLKIVRSEINRLNVLVNELLDVAKMQSGNVEFKFHDFDITEAIRNCLIKLEPIINEKNIDVIVDFENDPEYIHGDRSSIDRVLINLIQNATKFTPKGGKIEIRTREKRDIVEIYVKDNGIGISEENLQRVFERFYKADRSRGEDKKGTGLGLSIVKKILQAHGNDITVKSELNKGSEFMFTLSKSKKEYR